MKCPKFQTDHPSDSKSSQESEVETCCFMKWGVPLFLILSLGVIVSSQQRPKLIELGKPSLKISISPKEPTTEDMITFTVEAQDNSGTGLKRIIVLVNDREANTCLTSPCVFFGGPYPEGPLKYGAKVYDHTDNEPAVSIKVRNFGAII